MVKYGTKRPVFDCAKIGMMTISAVEYSNMGYADDLQYYQGKDSIFKAKRLGEKMSKEKAHELVSFIIESNNAMEKDSIKD